MPDIRVVGPWILLGIGVVILLGAVYVMVATERRHGLLWMWIFGVLPAGLGVFGLEFFEPYRSFVAVYQQAVQNPSESTYSALLEKASSGALPPDSRKLALAYMEARPVPNLDQMLKHAIAKTDDSNSKKDLQATARAVHAKSLIAADVLKGIEQQGQLNAGAIQRLDPATQRFILQGLPPDQLRRLKIDREVLGRLRGTEEARQ